ncbi:histidine kinase [uncultured Winogradskyella sp.]|uniref:tetratricopeptide repeat-containing sensor histidine kinase n=1 Tax=uncultured Winogradskyella sp. TaxID=395353 RepID=UPI0026132478|nr:histidine kinase [uncultured Winogradskyella sp.]
MNIHFSVAQNELSEKLEKLYDDDQYQEIITILDKKDSLTIREEIYYARSLGRLAQFSNGLILSNKIIEKCIKNKDTSNLVIAYNLKIENLTDLRQTEEGLAFYNEILPVFRKQDSVQFQLLCFKIGALYLLKKDYQKAYETYNRITIKKYKELGVYLNNYGTILFELKKWDEALPFYKKALAQKRKIGDLYSHDIYFSNIALVYLKKNMLGKAKVYLDSATNVKERYKTLHSKKALYGAYSSFYNLKGDIGTAAEYLDSISLINNQIFDKKLNEKLNELEALNIRENSLKQKVKIIDNELSVLQKQKLYIIIGVLLLTLILGSFIFLLRIRHIKSKSQNIITEQKLLRSQMTPHFIFNSLSVLQGIILNKEEKKATSYLSKFSKLLRQTLENSRGQNVTLHQEIKTIEHYLALQNLGISEPVNYTITIEKNIDPVRFYIPPMLIQPFVENAVEHAFVNKLDNKTIHIHIKHHDKSLVCTIIDNGIGIDSHQQNKSQNKKSLATTITSERLKLLAKNFNTKGGITVEDRKKFNEQGTVVTLIIPHRIDSIS